MIAMATKVSRICMSKTTVATKPRLSGLLFGNSAIFKLSLSLSLTHLRAQSACYELKGDLSPVI